MQISAIISQGRPEISQTFTTCLPHFKMSGFSVTPPHLHGVSRCSSLRWLCLTGVIEVPGFSQLCVLLLGVTSEGQISYIVFPQDRCFHPSWALHFNTAVVGESSPYKQQCRGTLGSEVRMLANAFGAKVLAVLSSWSALTRRRGRCLCEAAWHEDSQCSSWVSSMWQQEHDLV